MNKKVKIASVMIGVFVIFLLYQNRYMDNEVLSSSWNLPLSGKIIILDPGHGGVDGGADNGKIQEKDIALQISLKLRDYLQEQGALVIMTREKDVDLASNDTRGYSRRKTEDLKKRVELINESTADLYLSIHLNAIPSPKWSGAQTFYYGTYEENELIAKFIQDELRKNLGNTTRSAKAINHVYLMKKANKPGALVEVGFLSNEREKSLLIQEEYQEKLSASIYYGILRYVSGETNPPE